MRSQTNSRKLFKKQTYAKKKEKGFFFLRHSRGHMTHRLSIATSCTKSLKKYPRPQLVISMKKMFRASLRNDISPFHTLSSNLLLSFRSLTYFLSLPKASALYKRRRKFGLVFLLSKFKLSCVVGAFDARVEKKKSTKTNKKQKRT